MCAYATLLYKILRCSYFSFQAAHEIDCLELPLIHHTQMPDFDKLSSILSSKL